MVHRPYHDATTYLLGNYNGQAGPITPVGEAIAALNTGGDITAIPGVKDACTIDNTSVTEVAAAAPEFDAVIMLLGGGESTKFACVMYHCRCRVPRG